MSDLVLILALTWYIIGVPLGTWLLCKIATSGMDQ